MKKLILLSAFALICFAGFTKDLENFYMDNSGEKSYCRKITPGSEYIKATLENGDEVNIPTSQVKMYQWKGKVFEKLPVFVHNSNTGREEFMEFVATRAGLKLYKYTGLEETAGKSVKVKRFYVFKGDQYYNEINQTNGPALFDFFGI